MRVKVLGAPVDGLKIDQFVEAISLKLTGGSPCFIITLNPEMLYRAQKDNELMGIIKKADFVTADGIGIVWASRMAGRPVPERVTGIDLMMKLLEYSASRGWRVFFLGSAPGVAEAAGEQAEKLFPGVRVVGTHHGYFSGRENEEVIARIVEASPHLVFVALGSPRQEKWIEENLSRLGNVAAMGVGGSLDVLSGYVKRSPQWLNERNLEWLGRLLSQPSRWRRMLILPRFVIMVYLKHKLMPGKEPANKD